MTGEITHHLAAAGRMTDVNRVPQVEMVRDGLQIVGIMVEVVAAGHLRRAAVPAPVVRDDPITLGEEEQHLRVPIVRRERPAMTEHDRLAAAPIFIVDLYFVFSGDVAHLFSFLFGSAQETETTSLTEYFPL